MKKKIYIVVAALIVVAFVIFKISLRVDGVEYFEFDKIPDEYSVYVSRHDYNVTEYIDEMTQFQVKKYMLNNEEKQKVFDFIANARYDKNINFNLYWLIPGVQRVTSISTYDKVFYDIIVKDASGEEQIIVQTFGDDYLRRLNEEKDYLKVQERKWGAQLEELLTEAEIVDIYFIP